MKRQALSSALGRLIRLIWGSLANAPGLRHGAGEPLGVRGTDTDDGSRTEDDGPRTELANALGSGVLRQADDRTCGAASLIVARMLLSPAYARMILTGADAHSGSDAPDLLNQADQARVGVRSRFAAQSRLVHARTNCALSRSSRFGFRIRPPWPRALGTPPWGVRDELRALTEVTYRTFLIDSDNRSSRARAFAVLKRSVTRGLPAALFTGNDLSPRHVVLIIGRSPGPDNALQVFDPGRGAVVPMSMADFEGQLGDVAWTRPWAIVVPVR